MSHSLDAIREAMRSQLMPDEDAALERLVAQADLSADDRRAIGDRAVKLIRSVRSSKEPKRMEEFLAEYGLSTREGVALMCLAEALLRVPDAETMDDLIRDKIAPHDWSAHSGESASIFVNASTWALMLTGRVLDEGETGVERTLRGMVRRLGEPVIRRAVSAAMREMGEQFVLGRTITEAVKRGQPMAAKSYLYSYDMLGEAARTEADALRYLKAYSDAIAALAPHSKGEDIRRNPGISVKLSAIYPRYEFAQREKALPVMAERLLGLCKAAKAARMGLNIDAEEADRLDLSLDIIERVLAEPDLAGWKGFGVVVQAYGPRASFAIDWLHALAEKLDRQIMVRLVKGAYWDTEIKRAQVLGLPGYPVFTRKVNTDVSYIANARKLLGMTDRIYPQFATHNAHTVAAILAMGSDRDAFEFQRLHGMGETLHETVRIQEGTRCRIYAPVGAHQDLLAYLVRRLLENGANSSFVHQIVDEHVAPETIARDSFDVVASQGSAVNPAIPAPRDIFGEGRVNSKGIDLTDPVTMDKLEAERAPFETRQWLAQPMTKAVGEVRRRPVVNPAKPDDIVGHVEEAGSAHVDHAVKAAITAQPAWAARNVAERAAILQRAADLYEANQAEFFALATREAGKTLADGLAEVREAVDFLRYYAAEAEKAEVGTAARGVIVCISPWNFPLAIFTGQIVAALVTGNAVIAKPAEQTPLIAARAVALLHDAGVPADVLQLLPGDGPGVGAPLTAHPDIAGVCFTGSTDVARAIEKQLAETAAPDAMLIAETGGLNAMIVDSTALPEQAVRDILASAFQSAGQRCSALRLLYVQKDVEAKVMEMLTGAMNCLTVGDPWQLSTDVGPVIDIEARDGIAAYVADMTKSGHKVAGLEAPADGTFIAPVVLKVDGIAALDREIFGPVLHVARFDAEDLHEVIADINARGYGLTFGLHTRIDARVQDIVDEVHAGNIYVNRNQIGAVVGAQPFGGEGLSGTGPKAGGPHYLRRFRKTAAAPQGTGRQAVGEVAELRFPDAVKSGWAARTDRVAALRKALRGKGGPAISAVGAFDYGQVDLPGPTGEANTVALHPRGKALCLGPTDVLLGQVVQALAAGNAVVAAGEGAAKLLQPLVSKEFPLTVIDADLAPASVAQSKADVVAFAGDGSRMRALRQALARRAGAITPLVTEAIYPVGYSHERAVCVDTTAAGGNASLLAGA